MKKFILMTFFAALLSCNNSKNKQVTSQLHHNATSKPIEIKIDVDDKNVGRTAEDLFDEPTFVKLETTNNNLIGSISQVLFANDLIIVVDKTISNSISVFDMHGKFKNKIGKPGQGPGEYISCHDVALVPNSDQIAVLDDKLAKIHYYKIDGRYLNSVKFEFSPINMEFISSDIIAYSGLFNPDLNNNDLIITDCNNKVLSTYFKSLYKEDVFCLVNGKLIWKYDDKVFYNPNYNDTIFVLSEKSIRPIYKINIVKYGYPTKIDDKITGIDMHEYIKKYVHFDGGFCEFRNSAYFSIDLPLISNSTLALYSKKYKKTYLYNHMYNNPYFYSLNTNTINIERYKEDVLVKAIQAQELIMAKKMFDERAQRNQISKSKVDELYKGLSEEDNPVLFFFKINIKKKN